MKNLTDSPKLKRKDVKMLKLQTTLPIKRSQNEATFGAETNSAQIYKSHKGIEHSGFIMHSNELEKDVLDCAVMKKSNRINVNKKTAANVNFGGLPFPEGSKLSKRAWNLAQNKTFNKLSDLAAGNQTVFDALFALLITCGLRPAAIWAQSNENNKKKNQKAASHSIASGIIGYGFAVAVFGPIKKSLDKVVKNPDKYAKNIEKFLTYNGKKLIALSDRTATYKTIFNYGSQIFTASTRSAITIAMIPLIDKYILNKVFKTNIPPAKIEELKEDPSYKFALINFKNNPGANKVFQNFAGVMK